MPTSKPRITVTLTEYQHAMLRRISDAGGLSMSGVISEFMMAAQPTLERMAYAFHQLKQDRDNDHQHVADMLLELHVERDHKNRTNCGAGDETTRPPYQVSPGGACDSTNLSPSDSTDAIQYCASVDTGRPGSPDSPDSPRNEGEMSRIYEKRKKNASLKTKGRKK
jgi:hypothetical protein